MLHLKNFLGINSFRDALVAESVDAADLKSVGIYPVPVQVWPSAPTEKLLQTKELFLGLYNKNIAGHFCGKHCRFANHHSSGDSIRLPSCNVLDFCNQFFNIGSNYSILSKNRGKIKNI